MKRGVDRAEAVKRREYGRYVPAVDRLLVAGASTEVPADYCFRIEKQKLEMADADTQPLLPLSQRLRRRKLPPVDRR
ncbi:MAG: hypothetical protein ABJC74_03280, partial [Gemmatimonadota bacterium]